MNKKYILILLCFLPIIMIGCSKKDLVMKQVKDDMVVLNSKNTQDVNSLIWGSDCTTDFSTISSLETPDTENSSIIDSIISRVKVEVVSAEKDKVTLKVTSPNLESFFEDSINEALDIKDDDLLANYMLDYIDQTDLITKEVEINVIEKNGDIRIDYTDPKFINAFTGGLVDGYTSVRNSLLVK